MIEYIPIIGFIVMCVRMSAEQSACLNSNPFGPICNHEWQTWDRFNTAFLITIAFIGITLILVKVLVAVRSGEQDGDADKK